MSTAEVLLRIRYDENFMQAGKFDQNSMSKSFYSLHGVGFNHAVNAVVRVVLACFTINCCGQVH